MEGFLIGGETEFLPESFDLFDRVNTGRENEEDRSAGIGFLVGFEEWNGTIFDELLAEFFFDEQTE